MYNFTALPKPIRLLPIVGFFISFLFVACEKEPIEKIPSSLLSDKEIVSFRLQNADSSFIDSSKVLLSVKQDTLDIEVPAETNITNLVPWITIKGLNIFPASGLAQNFTNPVEYTITAEDSSSRKVTVVLHNRKLNLLYVGGNNNLFYAIDPMTGIMAWSFTSNGTFAFSDPIVSGNIVYAGSGDGYLYALHAATGKVIWKTFTHPYGIESPPSVSGNTVFAGADNGIFYAFNKYTGEIQWQYQTYGNVSTKGIIFNNKVIFGSSDGSIYALNEATGELNWKYTTGAMINQSSPVLHNGVVFAGSRDAFLYAINAETGELKWKYDAEGISLEESSPAVANGVVYIGSWYDINDFSKAGSLIAVDEETGELVWKKLEHLGITASPCISDGKLFISADDGIFYAMDAATGTTLWQKQIYCNGSSASVKDGIVYVGGGGSWYFYAYNVNTGDELWRFDSNQALNFSTPAFSN